MNVSILKMYFLFFTSKNAVVWCRQKYCSCKRSYVQLLASNAVTTFVQQIYSSSLLNSCRFEPFTLQMECTVINLLSPFLISIRYKNWYANKQEIWLLWWLFSYIIGSVSWYFSDVTVSVLINLRMCANAEHFICFSFFTCLFHSGFKTNWQFFILKWWTKRP